MITINGTAIKDPSDYSAGIQDLDKAERNANGKAIIENIAKKYKLELGWKYLSKTELDNIKTLVKGVNRTVTVVFIDQDGETNTGTFYSGDLVAPMWRYYNNTAQFKDVKLSLVEV